MLFITIFIITFAVCRAQVDTFNHFIEVVATISSEADISDNDSLQGVYADSVENCLDQSLPQGHTAQICSGAGKDKDQNLVSSVVAGTQGGPSNFSTCFNDSLQTAVQNGIITSDTLKFFSVVVNDNVDAKKECLAIFAADPGNSFCVNQNYCDEDDIGTGAAGESSTSSPSSTNSGSGTKSSETHSTQTSGATGGARAATTSTTQTSNTAAAASTAESTTSTTAASSIGSSYFVEIYLMVMTVFISLYI